MFCKQCWDDAYLLALNGRPQMECYLQLLEQRKENPCRTATYICRAVESSHFFSANSNHDRVPHNFGEFVCKEHLEHVNKCRADKGLEPLIEFPDSYDERR